MTPPKYQAISKSDIPSIPLADDAGDVRIIAGEFQGVKGPASTFSPIKILDFSLKDKVYEFEIEPDFNSIIFVRRGKINLCNSGNLATSQIALLSQSGNKISIEPLESDTSVLLLSGKPLNEPIAAQGPFCMNTEEELYQAFSDYQTGKLGK